MYKFMVNTFLVCCFLTFLAYIFSSPEDITKNNSVVTSTEIPSSITDLHVGNESSTTFFVDENGKVGTMKFYEDGDCPVSLGFPDFPEFPGFTSEEQPKSLGIKEPVEGSIQFNGCDGEKCSKASTHKSTSDEDDEVLIRFSVNGHDIMVLRKDGNIKIGIGKE